MRRNAAASCGTTWRTTATSFPPNGDSAALRCRHSTPHVLGPSRTATRSSSPHPSGSRMARQRATAGARSVAWNNVSTGSRAAASARNCTTLGTATSWAKNRDAVSSEMPLRASRTKCKVTGSTAATNTGPQRRVVPQRRLTPGMVGGLAGPDNAGPEQAGALSLVYGSFADRPQGYGLGWWRTAEDAAAWSREEPHRAFVEAQRKSPFELSQFAGVWAAHAIGRRTTTAHGVDDAPSPRSTPALAVNHCMMDSRPPRPEGDTSGHRRLIPKQETAGRPLRAIALSAPPGSPRLIVPRAAGQHRYSG